MPLPLLFLIRNIIIITSLPALSDSLRLTQANTIWPIDLMFFLLFSLPVPYFPSLSRTQTKKISVHKGSP